MELKPTLRPVQKIVNQLNMVVYKCMIFVAATKQLLFSIDIMTIQNYQNNLDHLKACLLKRSHIIGFSLRLNQISFLKILISTYYENLLDVQ